MAIRADLLCFGSKFPVISSWHAEVPAIKHLIFLPGKTATLP